MVMPLDQVYLVTLQWDIIQIHPCLLRMGMVDMLFLQTLIFQWGDLVLNAVATLCRHLLVMVLLPKELKEIIELPTKGNLQNLMTAVLLQGMLLHYN
jgi:hypothetical protein